MENDNRSLRPCSAQTARKIDTLALQIGLKISFIVLDYLSITHSSRSLNEVIMALFEYFEMFEHTVFECAQVCGLKQVAENGAQKQLQKISESKPKKKRQQHGNYEQNQ